MPASDNNLPEGTDSIITGAGVTGTEDMALGGMGASSAGAEDYPGGTTTGSSTSGGTTTEAAKAKIAETASGLKGQAADKARSYATQGKDRATDALDNIASLVSDAALQVDERVGEQYGAYARQAANAVSSLASTLRQKDVDELFDDARDAVRKSPAIAIGAAAALGFVLARVAKAGTDATVSTATATTPPVPTTPPSNAAGYSAAPYEPSPVTPTQTAYDAPPSPTAGVPGVPPIAPVA